MHSVVSPYLNELSTIFVTESDNLRKNRVPKAKLYPELQHFMRKKHIDMHMKGIERLSDCYSMMKVREESSLNL